MENFRRFDATDPYGRVWHVEFRWQQNAITIRHSDSVDVKFQIANEEDVTEKIIAIPHPDAVALSKSTGRPVTDGWLSRLAALHLKEMIETDRDIDKTLVTPTMEDLKRHAEKLNESATTRR